MAAVSVVLALLLLPLAASAGALDVKLLQTRQQTWGRQWYKPGIGCFKREESCLGTDVWCTKPEYYKDIEGYDSQKACFNARVQQTEWRYINTDCLADFEICEGTDVVCSRVKDSDIRKWCYAARRKGTWLQKYSPGCIAAERNDDERCIGTLDFCKAETRVKSYGSVEACLARREEAPKESKEKDFLIKDDLKCYGDPTEDCVGTEKFCSGATNALSCIESHEKPPFYDAESPDCYATRQQGYFSEACRGTKDWCASETRVRIYGSAERCVGFRQRATDGPSKWVPPNQACHDNSDRSEQCRGTEEICQYHSADRDGCYSRREVAPFLLPKPGGCPQAEQTAESCMGTDFHCHKRYNETNYFTEGECFSRRGFKHDEMVAKIVKKIGDKIADAILQKGEKVVKYAVYYDLVRQGGDEKSAMKSVKEYVDKYFVQLQEALPGATESYIAKVQKMAGA